MAGILFLIGLIGGLIIGAAGWVGFLIGIYKSVTIALLLRVPCTPIASTTDGRHSIEGKVELATEELLSFAADCEPVAWRRAVVQEFVGRRAHGAIDFSESVPFYVRDAAGDLVTVDADRASVTGHDFNGGGPVPPDLDDIARPRYRWPGTPKAWYEYRILDGDQVRVTGMIEHEGDEVLIGGPGLGAVAIVRGSTSFFAIDEVRAMFKSLAAALVGSAMFATAVLSR